MYGIVSGDFHTDDGMFAERTTEKARPFWPTVQVPNICTADSAYEGSGLFFNNKYSPVVLFLQRCRTWVLKEIESCLLLNIVL